MASSKCKGVLKDEKTDLQEEQLSKKEGKLTDRDSTSDECTVTENIRELQNHLLDALEKSRQWLEYDQQREAYVRAFLARMLWLEKQLNEANQARLQQHNEDHSDEKEQISQMQEHYERLLQEAKDELGVLREQVDIHHQSLIMAQYWWEAREREVEELKQQLQTEKMSRKSVQEDHLCSEYEKQRLRDETKDLQRRLDKEKRRSSYFEQQASFCQKFILNRRHADQEMIADLERQREQVDGSSCEAAFTPSLSPRDSLTSSPHSSVQNESFLECPSCLAKYAASHHRELLIHLDICLGQCLSTFSSDNHSE